MTETGGKKEGRGGARLGAGRSVGTKKEPGKQYTIYLNARSSAYVEEQAKNEGLTPYAWIVQTIQEALRRRR